MRLRSRVTPASFSSLIAAAAPSAVRRWWPSAVLVGAVVLLCADRLMDRRYPLPSPLSTGADLVGYFYPAVVYTRASLMRGEIPLWNPHQFAGTPYLAAHQPAVLYPPLLACLWLPPHLAIAAHALLHVGLAGLFTYAYARRIGLGSVAAVAAGLAYMLSYAVLESVFNTAYLSSYVWLPAVLWGVYELVDTPSAKGVLILGGSVALGILSGHAQAFLYIAQLGCVYGVILLAVYARRRAANARAAVPLKPGAAAAVSVACALAAVMLGGAVASAQLAMTAELAAAATRTFSGLTIRDAGAGFSLEMMVRGLTGPALWATISRLTIPLALVALAGKHTRFHALFFVSAGLLLFDFLRGGEGFVYPAYYHLPLASLFRIPARAAFIYVFCSAMVIGIGIDVVLRRIAKPHLHALAAALLVIVAGAESYVRGEVPVRYFPLTKPEQLDPSPSLAEFAYSRAQHDRIFLERDIPSGVQFKFGQLHAAFVVPDYEPFLPADYREFFGVPASRLWPGGLTMTGTFGPETVADPRLLDLLSVRYYADVRQARRPQGGDLVRAAGGKYLGEYDAVVLERDAALPRAYVVHEAIRAASAAEALALVRRREFDPRRSAVIGSADAPPEPAQAGAWEYARILSYGPHRVDLEVRCASACLAVLTDLHYPGWVATIDGKPTPVARTNYLVRSVRVPAGTHDVTYLYEPSRWRASLIVSGLAGMALFAVAARVLMDWRRRMRKT